MCINDNRLFEYETLVNQAYGYAKVKIEKTVYEEPYNFIRYSVQWLQDKEDSQYLDISLGSHNPNVIISFLIGILFGLQNNEI